jgi:predicted RNase H-like nuclease
MPNRKGWVGVVVGPNGFETAAVAPTIQQLRQRLPGTAAVAIDIPIGLSEHGSRKCDKAARDFVGPRRNSVFMTPPRRALELEPYEAALAFCRTLPSGGGLSRQVYGLRRSILEVAGMARPDDDLYEIHPAVSFRAMADAPLTVAKTTWTGMWQRIGLLERVGIAIPRELGSLADGTPSEDLLDAAAAAWSAWRILVGTSKSVSEPESGIDGRLLAIWY